MYCKNLSRGTREEKRKELFLNLVKVISGRGSWTETCNDSYDNQLTGSYDSKMFFRDHNLHIGMQNDEII